jgi:hypothetical protein
MPTPVAASSPVAVSPPVAAPPPDAAVPRDVPVQVAVVGELGGQVTDWLERDLGWQVVSGHGALAPLGVVTDQPDAARGAVVVVDGRRPDAERADVLRRGLRAGALDVVTWQGERDRLVAAVLATAVGDPDHAGRVGGGPGRRRPLRVAGVCGGAGASTVALALGAWAAWSGARVVVVGGDDLLSLCGLDPWQGPGSVELAALPHADAGAEVMGLSHGVPGVERLRVLGGGGRVGAVDGWPVDLVVVDAGLRVGQARLLVGTAGRRLAAVAGRRGHVLVRVRDATSRRAAVRTLRGSPGGWIADDPRVARAGQLGSMPATLPGRWLADLAGTVAGRVGAGR